MPIVIEEISGVVEPESAPGASPEPGEAAPRRAAPDPRALRAELRRMAVRRARLAAD